MVVVKPGSLVRYKKFPHQTLHSSGMIGLVLSEPQCVSVNDPTLVTVDVIWSMDRGLSYPAGTVSWDYVDELEVVRESR